MRPSLQSRGAEFLVDVPVLGKDADDVEWYPDRHGDCSSLSTGFSFRVLERRLLWHSYCLGHGSFMVSAPVSLGSHGGLGLRAWGLKTFGFHDFGYSAQTSTADSMQYKCGPSPPRGYH